MRLKLYILCRRINPYEHDGQVMVGIMPKLSLAFYIGFSIGLFVVVGHMSLDPVYLIYVCLDMKF